MAATLTREAPVDLVTGEPLIRIEFGFTFPPLNLLIALVGTLLLALLIMQLPLRRCSSVQARKRDQICMT